MNLNAIAFAKAAAIFMFFMGIINSVLVYIYFQQLDLMQLAIPLVLTPIVAAVAGYVFARLYNYFAH